jgi:hypothetical protein
LNLPIAIRGEISAKFQGPNWQQVAFMFVDFHMLVVDDGIDPQVAHQAFLAIDEYRPTISNHIPGATYPEDEAACLEDAR